MKKNNEKYKAMKTKILIITILFNMLGFLCFGQILKDPDLEHENIHVQLEIMTTHSSPHEPDHADYYYFRVIRDTVPSTLAVRVIKETNPYSLGIDIQDGDDLIYEQLLEELSYIMKKVNETVDLRYVHHFGFSLGRLGDKSTTLVQELMKYEVFSQYKPNQFFGNENDDHPDIQLFKSIVFHSLFQDFNAIFYPYSISLDNLLVKEVRFTPVQINNQASKEKKLEGLAALSMHYSNDQLNEEEAVHLDQYRNEKSLYIKNFQNKKVAAVIGHRKHWVSKDYLFQHSHCTSAVALTPEEKKLSNGYDAILFSEVKVFDSQDKERLLLQLKQKQDNLAIGIWSNFLEALRENDTDYLLAHSFDTVQCVDCVPNTEKEYFPAETVFEQYISKLIDITEKRQPSIYIDDTQIRVSYNEKKKLIHHFLENPQLSSVVYSFKQKEGQYQFEGMFDIP